MLAIRHRPPRRQSGVFCRLYILERESLLGDRAAEQVGQVVGSSVHLILGGRDVEVLDEVLKDSDRLSSLLAGDSRNGRNINSRHFDRERRCRNVGERKKEEEKGGEKKRERVESVLLGYLDKRWRAHETASGKFHSTQQTL